MPARYQTWTKNSAQSVVTHDAFPRTVVLGSKGRLGRILRIVWGNNPKIVWHARRPAPSVIGCDLLDNPEELAQLLAPAQAVIVLAGPAGQGGQVHADLARAVLSARPSRARVFLPSSAAVYGAQANPLIENRATQPLSPYGRAKAQMEATVQEARNVTSLRIGNVAGADAALGGWHSEFKLDQFSDGRTPLRSYIGPIALANALADLVAHPGPLPSVLNVAQEPALEMGAVLDAAQLPYAHQPAPPSAIAEVSLCTKTLARYTELNLADAKHMVSEWRALRNFEAL